jgi:hypothetical protein
MNAYEFCGNYGRELPSGKVTFSKKHIDQFIDRYTHSDSKSFTKQMRERIKSFLLIDMYNASIGKYSILTDINDDEKIEIPKIVFE